jgi:transposase-like protein
MDETYVHIAGRWMYLFRAVDSGGPTVDFYLSETRDCEAAKIFLKRALANPDNQPPRVFARDGLRSYSAAIRDPQREGQLQQRCRQRTDDTAITGSSPTIAMSNGACGPCRGRETPRRPGR